MVGSPWTRQPLSAVSGAASEVSESESAAFESRAGRLRIGLPLTAQVSCAVPSAVLASAMLGIGLPTLPVCGMQ